MKSYFFLIVFALFANTSLKAQIAGDFILAKFDPTDKTYFAKILSVEDGILNVRFLHSSSLYKFTYGTFHKKMNNGNKSYKGKVISNVGGIYGKDNAIYHALISRTNLYTGSTPCVNPTVILEFSDGKEYLATFTKIDENIYSFIIAHSGKNYKINLSSKEILSSDGTYKAGGFLKNMYCTDFSDKPQEIIEL